MIRTIVVGCALLAGLSTACTQTLVLDDLGPDAGSTATDAGPSDAAGGDARCFGNQPQPIPFTPDIPQVIVALDCSTGAMMTNAIFGANEFLTAVADLSTVVSRYH